MPEPDPRYAELISDADDLLESPQAPGLRQVLIRLRLARDELSTKLLKRISTKKAERIAEAELSDATRRIRQEINFARRASDPDNNQNSTA